MLSGCLFSLHGNAFRLPVFFTWKCFQAACFLCMEILSGCLFSLRGKCFSVNPIKVELLHSRNRCLVRKEITLNHRKMKGKNDEPLKKVREKTIAISLVLTHIALPTIKSIARQDLLCSILKTVQSLSINLIKCYFGFAKT